MKFLDWYLEKKFRANIFVEPDTSYHYKRPYCDGYAKACDELYNILKDITNG